MRTIKTKNEEETAIFAQKIAKNIKNNQILCLNGNLGAGKTVLSREIIRFLTKNSNLEVPSPTFTLLQTYETANNTIFHFDLYRLKNPEDIYELGWEDAIHHITIIEWPEKAQSLIPRPHTQINIETIENEPNARQITIMEVT